MSGFRSKLRTIFDKNVPGPAPGPSQPSFDRPAPLQPYWTADFGVQSKVSSEWVQEVGGHGWGNDELQTYTASDENASFSSRAVSGPSLVLRAIVQPGRTTSARLTSRVTLGRDKGYLSARITAPTARGVWPAFWLLPREPFTWPNDGEIDVMESWNGEKINHSCLHWGQHNAQDHNKHRVVRTAIQTLDAPNGVQYGFAWHQNSGRLMWYVDGRPVMQTGIPRGMRSISDFQIKLNIALGGNVCNGIKPVDGTYEMVVHDLGLYESPPGGWGEFDRQLRHVPGGAP